MNSGLSVPIKWVLGGIAWLLSAFGSAMILMWNLSEYKTETDAKIDALEVRSDALENAAALGRADHDLLLEMRGDIKVIAAEARTRAGDK